jgi:acyl dehydratase
MVIVRTSDGAAVHKDFFASEFDAQPMHLDEAAGKASILGGLSASGWHTCAMFMRLICDGFLLDSTSQGSPGIDYAKWKKPVLAGDTLTGKSTVLSTRISKSRRGIGFVAIRCELVNQRGEQVFELQNTGMFLTREAAQ